MSRPLDRPSPVSDYGDTSAPDTFTAQENRILTRKLDRRIVPVVFGLYVLASIDRSNIGNAHTAGMDVDLGFGSAEYQWLLTIFYISYILFQVAVLAWKTIPPRVISSVCAFAWGVTSMLQATAFSWSGLMAARFFIGAFEASFAPGIAMYLSFFYPRYQFGLRFGIFASAGALASSFAGALAYAIVHATSAKIATWRLLFIVEGAPTVLFAPFVYFILPNSIKDCTFLTPREIDLASARMRSSTSVTNGDKMRSAASGVGGINWKEVFHSFRDPTNYISAALFFIANVTYASLPVYLPTILTQAGFSSVRAQGLSAPPYLAAWISAISFMLISDRVRHRGLFVSALAAVGGTGYVVLATCTDAWVRYAALFLVAIGCFTIVPLLYTWVSNNQVKESQRGTGFAIFGLIGQCGPLLGVRLYPAHEGPYFVRGMSVGAGLLFSASIIALCLSLYFRYLNARLDHLYGPPPPSHKSAILQDEVDANPHHFRYVT